MTNTVLPDSPTNGQKVPINGYDYIWNAAKTRWESTGLPPASMSSKPITNQIIEASAPAVTPLIAKATTGQVGDVFQMQDASSSAQFRILPDGSIKALKPATFSAGLVSGAAITLPAAAPTADAQAANKKYVDDTAAKALADAKTSASTLYLSLAGGTLTGALTGTTATFTGVVSVGTPIGDGDAATKKYVDDKNTAQDTATAAAKSRADAAYTLAGTKITQAQGDGRYFRKTGGTVSGSVTVTGNMNVNGYIHSKQDIWAFNSDRNIKDEFEDMPDDCLERNHLMKGMTFIRTDLDDGNRRYAGIIAQDVGEAIPEAIEPDDKGILRVDPNGLFGHLVNCINRLTNELEHCKFRLSMLEGGSDDVTN